MACARIGQTHTQTLLKHDNDTAAPNGRRYMELHEGDSLMAGSRRVRRPSRSQPRAACTRLTSLSLPSAKRTTGRGDAHREAANADQVLAPTSARLATASSRARETS